MANIFIVSDTHFSHANCLKFIRPSDNLPMRDFASVEEMDEFMIEQWNKIVRPHDKVYHLGDVSIKRPAIALVGRCNGHKRLVRGNHDIFATKYYLPYFEEIYATRVFEDMILSHIPIHPESVKRFWTNVHGHVHNNQNGIIAGSKYLNVCVEMTEYRPLAIEEVRQRIKGLKAWWEEPHMQDSSYPGFDIEDNFIYHRERGLVTWVERKNA